MDSLLLTYDIYGHMEILDIIGMLNTWDKWLGTIGILTYE